MASLLPQSPDYLRLVGEDVAVNTVTQLGGAKYNNVISGQGATATLTAAQSGSLVLFDRAAGIIYTLPAPTAANVGKIWFDFLVTTAVTSNAYTVVSDAATTFVQGGALIGIVDTTPGANPGPKFEVGNGTTHVKVTMNGSTTGGLVGTQFRARLISTTVWDISGLVVGSGTIATIYST